MERTDSMERRKSSKDTDYFLLKRQRKDKIMTKVDDRKQDIKTKADKGKIK